MTIIEKSMGNVALFAFDQGQALSERTAPFDALVYILEGKEKQRLLTQQLRSMRNEWNGHYACKQTALNKGVDKFQDDVDYCQVLRRQK